MVKEQQTFLEYASLPGYKFSYRNKDEKRDGGIGIYVKDCITYRIRNYIISLDSLGHLWVEVKGKNKKSSYLTGIIYQYNSENTKNIEWIEKIDAILSSVKSTWHSTIIKTDRQVIPTLTCYPVRQLEICTNNKCYARINSPVT